MGLFNFFCKHIDHSAGSILFDNINKDIQVSDEDKQRCLNIVQHPFHYTDGEIKQAKIILSASKGNKAKMIANMYNFDVDYVLTTITHYKKYGL